MRKATKLMNFKQQNEGGFHDEYILRFLLEHESSNFSSIQEYILLKDSTLNKRLKGLIKKGFIEKILNAEGKIVYRINPSKREYLKNPLRVHLFEMPPKYVLSEESRITVEELANAYLLTHDNKKMTTIEEFEKFLALNNA